VRNTKVCNLRAPFASNQDVSRCDVAMNDAALMCRRQPSCNLRRNRRRATRNKWPHTTQHGGEIFAIDKLHDDRWCITLWGHVKHRRNIRVRNDRCGTPLCTESCGGVRGCSECTTKHLYRHIATEHFVCCAEDGCRGTFTNLFL
jgi:hypothetical protein